MRSSCNVVTGTASPECSGVLEQDTEPLTMPCHQCMKVCECSLATL